MSAASRSITLACTALLLGLACVACGNGHADGEGIAAPVVPVARVERRDMAREVSFPAEFRPYNEVELHAKVAGYVKEMKVDIGDHVRAGQLLAVLEVPELRDDLDHATASWQRAQADYTDAHLAYTRLSAVNKDHPNLIAQADLDTAEAHEATARGALAAAHAEVDKYQTLAGYARIVAPFAGIITKRFADPGSLIQAGTASNTQAMPLVRVSDNSVLRLDFPVSVDYVAGVHLNAPVRVRVESLDGRTFEGRIARFAGQVDDATRTMVVELEVPNPSLELVPGMYATVLMSLDARARALAIPIEALTAGRRQVLLVNAQKVIELRPVTLGVDTPTHCEVLSGLKEGDLVMVGNPRGLTAGQKVEPRLTAPVTAGNAP
jgi:RND family efflux transporter MFP subunit